MVRRENINKYKGGIMSTIISQTRSGFFSNDYHTFNENKVKVNSIPNSRIIHASTSSCSFFHITEVELESGEIVRGRQIYEGGTIV